MRVGVMLPMAQSDGPGRVPTWPEMLAFAQHAASIGLHSVWVCDHLFSDDPDRPEDPPEGIHEAGALVAALAATTTDIEIGQLVMCISFRNPALLAKMAATSDAISGGRLILGLGAGWSDPEYRAFGYPIDHRGGRFEEAIRIIRSLLAGETVTLDGRYHQVRDAVLLPPPDRTVPILVASFGARMLRLTARYADAWNTAWYGMPDERLHRRLAELEAAMQAEDRDPTTFRRTIGVIVRDPSATSAEGPAVAGSAEDLARAFDAHAALGFDDAVVLLEPVSDRQLELVGRALTMTGR